MYSPTDSLRKLFDSHQRKSYERQCTRQHVALIVSGDQTLLSLTFGYRPSINDRIKQYHFTNTQSVTFEHGAQCVRIDVRESIGRQRFGRVLVDRF
jgi:hypothetical protein